MGVGRTAEILAWGDGLVLKLFYDGFPAGMAVEEARSTVSLGELGLPVPRVDGVIEEGGRPGIVFERIEGPSMLARLTAFPWPVTRLARVLADLQISVHGHRVQGLASLPDALERRIRQAPGLSADEKEGTLEALYRLPKDSIVCHGDFHPDNVLLSPQGPMIIDWTDVHQGHPSADVAKTVLLLRLGEPPEGMRGRWLLERLRRRFQRIYLRRYREVRSVSPEELESWLLPVAAARLADGIPQEQKKLVGIVRAGLTDTREERRRT